MNALTINHASDLEFAVVVAMWGLAVLVIGTVLVIAFYALRWLALLVIEFIGGQIRWQRGRKHAKIIGFKVDLTDYKKRR